MTFNLLEENGEPHHDFGEKIVYSLLASGKQLSFIVIFGREEFVVLEDKLRSLLK